MTKIAIERKVFTDQRIEKYIRTNTRTTIAKITSAAIGTTARMIRIPGNAEPIILSTVSRACASDAAMFSGCAGRAVPSGSTCSVWQ